MIERLSSVEDDSRGEDGVLSEEEDILAGTEVFDSQQQKQRWRKESRRISYKNNTLPNRH